MPALSIWAIRSSFLHLLGGATIGGLLLLQKGGGGDPGLWRLLTLHGYLLLNGWLVQLTMGVAYWILPRWARGRGAGGPRIRRGREGSAGLAVILINAATAIALLGLLVRVPPGIAEVTTAIAVGLFVWHAWPRAKPFLAAQH